MMDSVVITDNNFIMYAIKHYDNPNCSGEEEFLNDLSRIHSIKRLLHRYMRDGEARERNVLNHLIVLYNVFGDAATKLVAFKLEPEMYPAIKSYMLYIERFPVNKIIGLEKLYQSPTDLKITTILRKI
jgi:hypothetical protein